MGTRIIPKWYKKQWAQEGDVSSHSYRMGKQGLSDPARLSPRSYQQQGITWVASSLQREEKIKKW